jgi:hypothetical protein
MLNENEERKRELWREGYGLMLEASDPQNQEELTWQKKIAEHEIECCGYKAGEILGVDFRCSVFEHRSIDFRFLLFRSFQAPASFGPMAHTLSFLSESLCQEQKLLHMRDGDSFKTFIYAEREQAMKRYLSQVSSIDEFTQSYGINVSDLEKESEKSLLGSIFVPSELGPDVAKKVSLFWDELYSVGVQLRLQRLYLVAEKMREQASPPLFNNAPEAIRKAYFTLRKHFLLEGGTPVVDEMWHRLCREDAAQDALMVLAMHQWKPEVSVNGRGTMRIFYVLRPMSIPVLSKTSRNH